MNIYGFRIFKRNIVFQCDYNAILSYIDFPREASQDMTWYIIKVDVLHISAKHFVREIFEKIWFLEAIIVSRVVW